MRGLRYVFGLSSSFVRASHLSPAAAISYRTLAALLAVFLIGGAVSAAGGPAVSASSAIIVDARSGQVLWSKNAAVRRPMASTTKVMTALLALELGNLDDVVTVPEGVEQIPEMSFHLIPGEKLTLRQLLYAVMVRSANDAAVVVARHIGGTEEHFVELMNLRARQLGLRDTQFRNPNGLHAEGHFSTAADLARLAREAIATPGFNEFCSTRSIVIERPMSQDRLLRNTARFLRDYPGADGIKTGYTRQAGRCFIGSATINGWRVITVVLNSVDAGADTRALMDYAFARFAPRTLAKAGDIHSRVRVAGGDPEELPLAVNSDLVVCVPRTGGVVRKLVELRRLEPPLNRGDRVGDLVVEVDGRPVQRVALVAADDVQPRRLRNPLFLAVLGSFPAGYVCLRRSRNGG
ncbi:MAG: serine-type D-Ala-D-Ala carboxypeptidase [Armatimonadota bacterium]|nr:MAG: serine-type D-Ala-D-Ala carboxypeptidase [Armatimonadota bacterium]